MADAFKIYKSSTILRYCKKQGGDNCLHHSRFTRHVIRTRNTRIQKLDMRCMEEEAHMLLLADDGNINIMHYVCVCVSHVSGFSGKLYTSTERPWSAVNKPEPI